jgi:transglutaminase-like putative cysteine protease
MSYVPAPTPAQLRAAPRRFPAAYLRYTAFDLPASGQSGLRVSADRAPVGEFATSQTVGALAPGRMMLPPSARRRILASPYAGMYRLARRLAAGARSTYEVVLRAQNYLQANYAYSEQTPRRRYPLEAFLFSDGVGYCQQFSGAMALILRMDGIPARVAAGFLPGAYDSATGTYDVRAVDAHSWVEVYFRGIGWVAFNPTPARTVGPPQRSVFASESVANPAQAIAATIGGLPPVRRTQARLPRRARGGVSGAEVALLALGGLALIALSALAVRWLAGNRRLRRSLGGDTELATQELVRALRRLGYALPATTTLAQIEGAVRLHGGAEAARYVALLREHRYGLAGDGRATLRDRRRLRHALTCHLGLDDRLRGHWALPPGTLAWRVPRPAQPAAPGGP